MFDQMKQMAKLAGVLKDLPKLKASVEGVKATLANQTVEGTAGSGAAVVRVNGQLRVLGIECAPALLESLASPSARPAAQAILIEAVNDGLSKAQAMVADAVHRAASELDLPIPEGMLDGLLR